ncbi:flippase-like domain-containing protein [bacterium]|nr:flippase-like domain-containing protein [bacterium]
MPAKSKSLIRWTVAVALLSFLVWLAARDLDPRALLDAIGAANLNLILLAALINLVLFTWLAALRLRLIIEPLAHQKPLVFRHLISVTLAQSAAHNILPAPAGEVLRTGYLARYYGFSLGDMVAAQGLEKVLEALAVTLEIGLLMGLASLPPKLLGSLGVVAAIGLGVALMLVFVGWISSPPEAGLDQRGLKRFLSDLGRGIQVCRKPRLWIIGLLYSLLADLTNAGMVWLVLAAVGVSLSLPSCIIVCLAMRVTGLVPSTPGQLGVQEAGAMAALSLFGVAAQPALAFALLYRASYWIPTTLVGISEFRHCGFRD